jgi:uncharacterized protein YxjI
MAFPLTSPNVRLAVFDRNWNLLHIENVTDFTRSDYMKGGTSWVIRHGNLLYVSYDVDAVNITTEEEVKEWQAYVSIYEISELTQNDDYTWSLLTTGVIAIAVVAIVYVVKKKR